MRKLLSTLILLLISILLAAELDPQFTQTANPELYTQLYDLATQNLNNIPKAQSKGYARLLKEHDDILMAYLIAYESDAKLAEAHPQILLSNYQEIVKLLQREGLQHTPEFFLSYIARQSVSDERLSAYRKAMLDSGLAEVAGIEDHLERYRATASWCVEKLKFKQTSGRDQNPVDIIQHSLIGRCEEMQILFVAAARSVGLPSRPASTPWWAHMDNNHAWAEVFLDGAWIYTGDMDAAYFPNQTWFSGMVDKTVMILAEGSLAAEEDEVLISGRYETVINSTPNYAGERIRRINISCLDSAANPMPQSKIAVLVYNWGALRPLITLKTDDEGKLSFSSGSGDFFLSAFKDGKQALQLVRASAEPEHDVELILQDAAVSSVDEMLYYPANEIIRQQAPDSYKAEIQARKKLWQYTIDSWSEIVSSSGIADTLGVAEESRGNFSEYRKFYLANQPLDHGFLEFLADYDPKFLWQADAALFEAVYRFWQSQDPDAPSQLFEPTVHYEELPRAIIKKSGAQLYPDNFVRPAANPRDKMQNALHRMSKIYKIDPQKALSGLLRMDLAATQKYLTDYQYRILAVSILRANGVPADFTRLPGNILVYLDNDWHYYDIVNETFSESHTGDKPAGKLNISVVDEDGFPLALDSERLSLSRYVDGVFYTLNSSFEALEPGLFQVQIPGDSLYLHFGYRVSDSQTALQIHPLRLDDSRLELVAKAYPKTWKEADKELLLLFDEDLLDSTELILLGNYDHENSLRILQQIRDAQRDYIFVGYAQALGSSLPNYRFSPSWQALVRENELYGLQGITLIKTDAGWKMYQGRWEALP